MNKLKDLRNKRGTAIAQARAIVDGAEAQGRSSLTAEEQVNYDKAWKDQGDIASAVDREEQLLETERSTAEALAEGMGIVGDSEESHKDKERPGNKRKSTIMTAFGSMLMSGRVPASDPEVARVLNALQADAPTGGGYLVPPEEFVNRLIKQVDDAVYIRSKATVMQVKTSDSLGVPSLDNDPDDADWTAEILTGSEDSTMSFGKRALKPHPLAKRIKVSKTLLRKSPMPVEQIVIERLAYKFAISQEKGFMTGSGANQPLGLFAASANGISTGRDISTGNTTTAIGQDNLRQVKYGVKSQYQKSGEWLMHRDAVKAVSILKDNNDQYLWTPGLTEKEGDLLLGRPLNISEYAPNTFTSGLYVGIFGDLSYYWIAEALDMTVQSLRELYAESNQDGFIGRAEVDGMPVLEEAFARMTLA